MSGALSPVLLVLNPSHPWNVSLDTGLVGVGEGRESFFVGVQCGGITHLVSNMLQGQMCFVFAAGTVESNTECLP